ncbi:MAG: signal recognition particle-docking protein FtsY [Dehalococcoidia bacterium]|nr:signal recognition particle-docking protein FtsY [Dehalococcoidia bacterium]
MLDLLKRTSQGVTKSRQLWFSRIAGLFLRGRVNDEVWNQLEELLISADVSIATTSRLLERIKKSAREQGINDGPGIYSLLKQEMVRLLNSACTIDSRGDSSAGEKILFILVVGVNGSGKTTSIAKLANYYIQQGSRVVLGAADTFRAAAIDQLKVWGKRAGADVIAHQPGSDPGAVVFDTIQAARARNAGVVIIDTAGRLHTKFNLMEELKKIQRVAIKSASNLEQKAILVIDATTGQNGLSQARHFTEAIGIDGIFLSKLDGTARGGIVLTICDELKIPVLFIGTGEQLDDMAPFDPHIFVEAIFTGAER